MSLYSDKYLFAFDFDGTLADKQGVVSYALMNALAQLQRDGHLVAIIMGRVRLHARIISLFGLDAYAICNGGVIYSGEKILKQQLIPLLDLQSLIELLPLGAEVHLIGHDTVFTNNKKFILETVNKKTRPLDEFSNQPVFSIQAVHPKCRDIRSVVSESYPNYRVTGGKAPFEEFISIELNACKGEALQTIADHFSLKISQTIAFGNDINDITLLEKAGLPIQIGMVSEVSTAAKIHLEDRNMLLTWLHHWIRKNSQSTSKPNISPDEKVSI